MPAAISVRPDGLDPRMTMVIFAVHHEKRGSFMVILWWFYGDFMVIFIFPSGELMARLVHFLRVVEICVQSLVYYLVILWRFNWGLTMPKKGDWTIKETRLFLFTMKKTWFDSPNKDSLTFDLEGFRLRPQWSKAPSKANIFGQSLGDYESSDGTIRFEHGIEHACTRQTLFLQPG
jgi:hypothetical protein